MKNGSILILTLVVIMILSIMAIAGLTVTGIEAETTGVYYGTKGALYSAIKVVETQRMRIANNPDPEDVELMIVADLGKAITGTLIDFEKDDPQEFELYERIAVPQFKGMSLSDTVSISPVMWYVPVTVKVGTGKYEAYSEIQSGIYSIVKTEY